MRKAAPGAPAAANGRLAWADRAHRFGTQVTESEKLRVGVLAVGLRGPQQGLQTHVAMLGADCVLHPGGMWESTSKSSKRATSKHGGRQKHKRKHRGDREIKEKTRNIDTAYELPKIPLKVLRSSEELLVVLRCILVGRVCL